MNVVFRPLDVEKDWDWITQIQPIHLVDDTSGVTALNADTGEILACNVLDNWTRNSVQAHLLMPNPMVIRHGFLALCTALVFHDMGCKYMYGQVPSTNEKAIRLNKHIGFVEVMRLKDALDDGVDYVIMSLAAEDCKVLPAENWRIKEAA